MEINQIYSEVNTIASNMGYTGNAIVDTSTFVEFGMSTLSSVLNKEKFYNSLVDRIKKVVVKTLNYKHKEDIFTDGFNFYGMVQKIRVATPSAKTDTDWTNPGVSPYTLNNPSTIGVKYYGENLGVFSFETTITDKQLESAFTSESEMAILWSAIYDSLYSAYERAIDGVSRMVKATAIGKVYSNSTATNYSRQVRKVVTEYNTLFSKSLTSVTCLTDREFLAWLIGQFNLAELNLEELTHLYNNGTYDDCSTPTFELSSTFIAYLNAYFSNTFSTEFAKIPTHKKFTNLGIHTLPQTVKVKIGESDITVSNVIGLMYSEDTLASTVDKTRFVSFYDKWNDRTQIKLTGEKLGCIDLDSNLIVWVLE